jgi:hypothetical protein
MLGSNSCTDGPLSEREILKHDSMGIDCAVLELGVDVQRQNVFVSESIPYL